MADKPGFKSQNNPIEGVDDAAAGFYEREKTRAAIRRGELPHSAIGKPIEEPKNPKPNGKDPKQPPTEKSAPEDRQGELIAADPDAEVEPEPSDTELGQEPAAEPDAEPTDIEIPPDALLTMADGSTVSLTELQKGYQRQSDYTKKTTELADQRREFDAKLAEAAGVVEQRLAQAVQLGEQLQQNLNRYMPNPQQLEQLRQVDPGEYAARLQEINNQKMLIAQAGEARVRLQQEAAERVAAERASRVPIEREALSEAIPAFRKNFDSEYEALGRYALASDGGGLRPEEWDLVDDHRYVTLVWKARQYDIATRKTAPAVRRKMAKKPRTVRSGAPRAAGDTQRDEASAALANLKANPDSRQAQHDAFLARERGRTAKRRAMRRTV